MVAAGLVAALPGGAAGAGERDDESQECWTYGGADQRIPGFGPGMCCGPTPCGQPNCWAPPEFQYYFCCQEPACRPTVLAEVQRGLGLGAAALPSENASQAAFRAAPEAFRALRRLRGLRLEAAGGLQGCNCAIAYAAAVLLEPGGVDGASVSRAITPGWFARGVQWREMVNLGWGATFAWLARPVHRASARAQQCPGAQVKTVEVLAARGGLSQAESNLELDAFLDVAQERARLVAADVGDGECAFSRFAAALHAAGVWGQVWQRVRESLEARKQGRKCVALPQANGHGTWSACVPWAYSRQADFSSPLPGAGARPNATAAVCVLGAPRNVLETYAVLREHVVKVVKGDAFVYVPFADSLDPRLERQLAKMGPIVTAIAVPDVGPEGMESRFFEELQDPLLPNLYLQALGPWRAPAFRQMGSSMWGYLHQHVCRKMVTSYEQQRAGRLYSWVIFARADLLWNHRHPPLEVLDPRYVYVPFGQDNSYYNFGPEPGLNDRHAAVPRHLVDSYFGRWEALGTGEAWRLYLHRVAAGGHLLNTEQYLLLHLRAKKVPVRRFPPVAFVVHCSEGPQCQHLYKGTNLRKQEWTQTAKYWSELIEVRRTVHDELHGVNRPSKGWIWERERPHVALAPQVSKSWEIHGLDFVCCSTLSGPVSCRMWDLLRRCQCLVHSR